MGVTNVRNDYSFAYDNQRMAQNRMAPKMGPNRPQTNKNIELSYTMIAQEVG